MSNQFSGFAKYIKTDPPKNTKRFALAMLVQKFEHDQLKAHVIPWAVAANSKEEAVGKGWDYLDRTFPAKEWNLMRVVQVDEFSL